MTPDGLLTNLNQSQHAAVSSFADTLAILAGPGSGKTHTLTSRTAWLLAQGLEPWNIIVATFTVKAAREMKERIGKLLGNGLESKLILGTFHSIARRYLARYGHLIDVKKDFGIADSADSLAIIKRICKRNKFMIDPKVARSRISGLKARKSDVLRDSIEKPGPKSVEIQEFEKCYNEYEEALKRSNLLDYDDLLLRCVDLLREHPSCVSNVEAVLIDEFQDTNIVQFDLMRLFAAQRKRITIVGDPDQSIYGFRAAEIKNYKRLLHQYPDTVTIALEENYRSSGAILLSALAVIEQDSSRVKKSLVPTHTVGTRPVLRKLQNAHKEAEWIVSEILRILGMTGDLLDLNDFAILLRSASLSRLIESALGRSGVAYRMVGGLRFYDRVEIKTILDYLRVINQPDNNDALGRIINVPSRRVGDATIKALLEEADRSKITLWTLILRHVQGKRNAQTKLNKSIEHSLASFVNIILTPRDKMSGPPDGRMTTVGLINYILLKTDYENWLLEHHGDVHKSRWDNVQELITQATDFEEMISGGYEDEALPEVEGLDQQEGEDSLSRFLANVALASEVKIDDAEGVATAQVTISTIHAAKGLEWPVVFIPATYEGSIPHSRAEDANEERRLLYVAMTRAQALLYMSCPIKNSQSEATTLSQFLTTPTLAPHLEQAGPSLGSSTVQTLAQILRRKLPSAASITRSAAELHSTEDNQFPRDGEANDDEKESRWVNANGNPTFTMGQHAPKRQRIELSRSTSNLEGHRPNWNVSNVTTMQQASTFTASSLATGSKFVSASSHFQAIKEQSFEKDLIRAQEEESKAGKQSRKPKTKGMEGQGTLLSFVGKAELPPLKHIAPTSQRSHPPIPAWSQTSGKSSNISHIRVATQSDEQVGIDPALANHRLGVSKSLLRPGRRINNKEDRRQEYVFLSSSPPRAKSPVKKMPTSQTPSGGLSTHPPLLPLIRPPLSLHNTSMNMIRNPGGPQKTLGMRRSMNGWSARKGQGFVPPTMKRKL